MIWKASAPSNIALIKYMGKSDFSLNLPANSSMSYTLDNLRTFVELEVTSEAQDLWQPLSAEQLKAQNCIAPNFSEKGEQRFLDFFKKLKTHYNVKENFIIRSANNFPSDSGMASSASSFAALTMAADLAFTALKYKNQSVLSLPQMSREGSGSSCRSFFSPWAVWQGTEVFSPEVPLQKLIHKMILIHSDKKEVSSGQAHKRIATSLLNIGRKDRAEKRLQNLLEAFRDDDWRLAFEITWAEFWDMHVMFETAMPSFRYMNSESVRALDLLDKAWTQFGDGPLVTMDAGANIHLLFKDEKIISEFENLCANNQLQFGDIYALTNPR